MIRPGEVLMIDSGSTTLHFARHLALRSHRLTVVTNSPAIAATLAVNETIRILLCPGIYDAREGGVFGAYTFEFLHGLNADRAVIGASGAGKSTVFNLIPRLYDVTGGEVLIEQSAHILVSEIGGIAGLAGMFHRAVPGKRGAMDIDALREKIRPMTRNNLGTTLVCMETSHNQAGGAVLPLAHMKAVHALAHENGVPVHTDGARLFNAAVALGVDASEIAQYTDSVGFCVSKGLSAPVGSVLCGTKAFIERARTFRRMVGGNMRQAGGLAEARRPGPELQPAGQVATALQPPAVARPASPHHHEHE